MTPGRAERGLDPRHIEDVLARTTRDVVLAAGGEAGLVLLKASREDRFLLRAPVGLDPKVLIKLGPFVRLPPVGPTLRALAGPGPVVTATDAESEGSSFGSVYAEAGFRAWAVLPLEIEGASAGVLHILARAPSLRASRDELAAIVRPLGPLAHALRALEVARAADERSAVVAQVAQGVLQHLDLGALFPELIRLLARLGPCDAAAVVIYRADEHVFETVAVYGPDLPDLIQQGTLIPADESAIRDAYFGDIVNAPDGRKSAYPRSRAVAEGGILSSLYIPIGNPVRKGVLCVGNRLSYAFGEEEVALYRSLVPFLEIALRNAELVGKIRDAYRELDATQERLVRAERLRALGELAAGVAHDVGNVLAVVASHAELARRRTTDDEVSRLLSACQESVADGTRAVRRVLDLARGTDSPEPGVKRTSLHAVARDALHFARPRWAGVTGEARYEVDTSALLPVSEAAAEPGEVREAVLNLILNALDAMPRGGKIALATKVDEDAVVLSVEDSGPGVAPALRKRIFEPFYTSKGPAHAGLGLSLVARLARQAGGAVRCLGAALGGARFELRLPIQELGSGPHELSSAEDAAPGPVAGIEVLLVEDEPALRKALAALLELRGHTVHTAGDVEGALATLDTNPEVQILVTDLGLPGRSGWELVDAMRRRSASLPIVVLSGWGALTDPATARDRGVSAVLSKPTTEGELARTIESLVVPARR